jgi:PHD/YefM family antitoxin component YafN of YafNO toxin-antitoxin module
VIHLEDIQSLTEFQRNSRSSIKRLKKTGRPLALTVNGQASVIVQDVKSYQHLLARAEQADRIAELSRSVSEFRAGRVRSIEDVLDDLEASNSGKDTRRTR